MNEQLTSYPKNKIQVVLLENISDEAHKQFIDAGYTNIKKITGALSEAELIEEIKNVHLLGIRSKTQISEKVFLSAPKLLAVGCYCIGVNQVSLKHAIDSGVVIFNSPYSNTRSVAELVIGSVIMLLRKIPDKNKSAHDGIWLKESKGCYELRGKTLGIIGYGNIGSQVSVLAETMGMHVLYYDIETKLPLGNAQAISTLKELLNKSDVVTLHVPQHASTKNMMTGEAISWMKKNSILINYARGNVVDLDALKMALEKNSIAGAAIDVFPSEPEKNGAAFLSPLQHTPNVILTPHIGGSTEEAQVNISADVTAKLLQYLEKGITTGSLSVPVINLPVQEKTHRILHIHKNIPGVLSEINSKLSLHNINILGQYLKTNDAIGYVVLDVTTNMSAEAFELLNHVKGTIKTRMLY